MNVGSSNDLKEQREVFGTDSHSIHYSGPPLACLPYFFVRWECKLSVQSPQKLQPEDLLSQVVVLTYGMEIMVELG